MAASVSLLPPQQFDFTQPDSWQRWIKRFERYRVASGLSERSEPVQISTLIYAMGEQAEDIFTSFGLSEEEAKQYSTVQKRFQDHLVQRRNPVYERARFNQRTQQPGETVDAFVTALHSLAENCDYSELRETMIRDRLVAGLLDASLSEKLQLEPDLTLQDAIKRARNSAAIKQQQATVRVSANAPQATVAVNAMQSRSRPHPKHFRTNSTTSQKFHKTKKQQFNHSNPARRCGWCGRDQHPRECCPAKNVMCRRCSKMGHYEAVCRSTASRTTARLNEVDGTAFLGALDFDSAWTKRVHVNGVPLSMKVDTGADVTAIPESVYRRTIRPVPKLEKTTRILRGPDGKVLPVLGQFKAQLLIPSNSNQSSHQTVYVIRRLQLLC